LLAGLYLAATTGRAAPGAAPIPDWWVTAGSPLLFLEARSANPIDFPRRVRAVALPAEYKLALSYCLWPYAGGSIRMWVLDRRPGSDYRTARTLRIYLMRLHAEHECLQQLLRNLREGHLEVRRGTPESDLLQRRLDDAMEKIGSYESRAARDFNPEIAAIARESVDEMSPGQRDRLVMRLKELDLRRSVVRDVKGYADAAVAAGVGAGDAQMGSETKITLARALLQTASFKNDATRDAIVGELPEEVQINTPRGKTPLLDAINIIGAALNYAGGLDALIGFVRAFEQNSLPMQAVDGVLAGWRETAGDQN
jgi:hypothetical protein